MDLVKPEERLVAAYDDSSGVTAAFNLNILRRLNRELGTDFDLERFEHRALWNEKESRMEMHLVSRGRQRVHLLGADGAPGDRIRLSAGETIHTENSYKFSPESIRQLLCSAGFLEIKSWSDGGADFRVVLASVE